MENSPSYVGREPFPHIFHIAEVGINILSLGVASCVVSTVSPHNRRVCSCNQLTHTRIPEGDSEVYVTNCTMNEKKNQFNLSPY